MRPRRQIALAGGVGVLAGVGLTALIAIGINTVEEARLRIEQRSKKRDQDIAFAEAQEKHQVVLKAEGHIRALLRSPRVSESDHETDREAAQRWLEKYGREGREGKWK